MRSRDSEEQRPFWCVGYLIDHHNDFQGAKNRAIAQTNMNEHSSRSHTIFVLFVEHRQCEDGEIKVPNLTFSPSQNQDWAAHDFGWLKYCCEDSALVSLEMAAERHMILDGSNAVVRAVC